MDNKKVKKQAEEYLKKLFTGRISRINYFTAIIVLTALAFGAGIMLISFIATFAIFLIGGETTGFASALIAILYYTILFLSGLYQISFSVRRFHDLGKDWKWVLWLFVPIANIYFSLLLLSKAGDVGPNEYGPAPEMKRNLRDAFKIG